MPLRLWQAAEHEKPALARAYAAYMADLCPQEEQQNPDPYFDLYWQEPSERFPYLFGSDEPHGFAFVRRPDEPDVDFEIAEFCVATAHRRRGVGTAILQIIFARHPGSWDVSVLKTNSAGLAFWPDALRKVGVRDLCLYENDNARTYQFLVP